MCVTYVITLLLFCGMPVFPAGIPFYSIEEVKTASAGADFIICGVSSFGAAWFRNEMLPLLPENVPVFSVTKGLMDTADGTRLTYPAHPAGEAHRARKAHPALCHRRSVHRL